MGVLQITGTIPSSTTTTATIGLKKKRILFVICSWKNVLLVFVLVVQWICFTIVLKNTKNINNDDNDSNDNNDNNNLSVSLSVSINDQQQHDDIVNQISTIQMEYKKLQEQIELIQQQQQQQDSELGTIQTKQQQQQQQDYDDDDEQQRNSSNGSSNFKKQKSKYDGVFVTIMYRAPRWMHLRYNTILYNAITNVPKNGKWAVQVFINEQWAVSNLYPYHPGLVRLLSSSNNNNNTTTSTTIHGIDIIKTSIPINLTQPKIGLKSIRGNPGMVIKSLWFWNSINATAVVLFSANGAFCSNHIQDPIIYWSRMISTIDYCGVPFNNGKKNRRNDHQYGGDSSTHSFINRNAMIRVLEYQSRTNKQGSSILEAMIQMNKEIITKQQQQKEVVEKQQQQQQQQQQVLFRIASYNDTVQFGGVQEGMYINDTALVQIPYIVSGIQQQLSYKERDTLLQYCPDIKIIFPSLHEPTCFGTQPDPVTCQATICALQVPIPSHGC